VSTLSVEGHEDAPSLLTPPMHFTISVAVPMLTVPICTPAGFRTVWSVRRVMSQPLRESELLTRTRRRKNELSPGRGPGIVGGVTGHTVSDVDARQTFPTRLAACADGIIPGTEYNPEIIASPMSRRMESFFKRAFLL